MVTASPAMVAQASRLMVSQPPVLIAAATHTPAVSAIAPIGSAPRYGLPTTTTAEPADGHHHQSAASAGGPAGRASRR